MNAVYPATASILMYIWGFELNVVQIGIELKIELPFAYTLGNDDHGNVLHSR